jgi:hypothetical protein
MIRRFFLLTLFLIGLPAPTVKAQTASALADLKISFWPEYDRRAMLVIYRGQAASGSTQPATLQFQIPARYGPPIAVAYINGSDMLTLDYTTALDGDSLTLSFTTPNGSFQFEYYDSSLDLSSSARRYTFAAASIYPISTLTFIVQQPPGATGLTATPPLGDPGLGADGLTYQEATLTNMKMGDPLTLSLTYTKTTDSLSAGLVKPAPSATPAPQVETTQYNWLYGLLGAVGVLLLAGGLIWYARPRRRPRPARVPARKLTRKVLAAQAGVGVFCHECGQASQPGDRFCRKCGTALRTSQ